MKGQKEAILFEIVTSTNIVQLFELHRDHRALRASLFFSHDSSGRASLNGSIMTGVSKQKESSRGGHGGSFGRWPRILFRPVDHLDPLGCRLR